MVSHDTPGTCLRCGGWVVPGADADGPFLRCLNCGRYQDLLQPPPDRLALMKRASTHNFNRPPRGEVNRNVGRRITEYYGNTLPHRERP